MSLLLKRRLEKYLVWQIAPALTISFYEGHRTDEKRTPCGVADCSRGTENSDAKGIGVYDITALIHIEINPNDPAQPDPGEIAETIDAIISNGATIDAINNPATPGRPNGAMHIYDCTPGEQGTDRKDGILRFILTYDITCQAVDYYPN